jgi:superfamily II DNA or RNA helicase
MKVVLDGWAWLEGSEMTSRQILELERKLTVKITPPKGFGADDDDTSFDLKLYQRGGQFVGPGDGWIGVPREFYFEHSRNENDVVDKMSDGHPVSLEFTGSHEGEFAEHAVAVDTFLTRYAAGNYGGVLRAAPAWGKTGMALSLISQLGRTAMVVLNRDYLIQQWKARIERFLPSAKIGIVRQDVCDFEGKDICLGLVQSLVRREYPSEFYDYFGIVVYDECHHVPSRTWSVIPPKFSARRRLGISATPRRKDGADPVIWWHLGQIAYDARKKTLSPRLKRVYTGWKLSPVLAAKKLKLPIVLKFLCADDTRNYQIANQVVAAITSDNARKVMVLSDRVKHLERIEAAILDILDDLPAHQSSVDIDYYVGGMDKEVVGKNGVARITRKRRTQKELDVAERAQVVLATYAMSQEALDIPALDVLMLATPRVDVEQAIGRIRRFCMPEPDKCEHYCKWRAGRCSGKPDPIIVDFVDDEKECSWRAARRMNLYMKIDVS